MVKNNTHVIIKYIIVMIAMLAAHDIIFTLLHYLLKGSMSELIIIITEYVSIIIGIVVWALCFIHAIKCIIYQNKTGRDFNVDHKEYKKDLFELITYIENIDKYKMNPKTLPVMDWWQADGVILGHVGERLVHRASSSPGNLAVFGLPGSHKTTSQIIPTALRFNSSSGGGGVFAIDIKGDILSWTKDKRNIIIFNPEDENSAHFDVFARVKGMTIGELCIYAEQIAGTVLPDPSGKEDTYFSTGGRNIFCGVMLYLLDQNIEITFPEVVDYILRHNVIEICKTIANSSCIAAQRYTNSLIGSSEKNAAGCHDCIARAVRPYTSGALSVLLDGNSTCISPQALLQGKDIYIEIAQDKIPIYAGISSLIVQTFLTAFMQMEDAGAAGGKLHRPSVIFLLDEFAQLNFDFSTLTQALSTLRSKGVSLFLSQQSIAQLEGKYGEVNCRAIIDTCTYVSILGAQDPRSREYFQKMIGRQLVLRKSTSKNQSGGRASRGESVQESMEYIFETSDIANLGDDVIICIGGKYIRAQKTDCWDSQYTASSKDFSDSTQYLEMHDK